MDIQLDRIARAATAIDPQFTNSPQFASPGLNNELRRNIVLKVETINPIRSFKGRGTSWFTRRFSDKRRALVCASAGNFGQGVAYCGRDAGLKVKVVAPERPIRSSWKRLGSSGRN